MKKIKLGLSVVIAMIVIFSLTACGTKATGKEQLDGTLNGGVSATVPSVTVEKSSMIELPTETAFEITKDELMELAWWHERGDEEEDIIDIDSIYPGFEFDCEIKENEYYRVFRSKEKGIEVLEKLYRVEEGFPTSGGEIIIRNNSGISKEYSVINGIGNTNNKEGFTREKKLFFQDLTNDGKEELVVSIPYHDMETHENYLYVFDSESFEQIALPDREKLRNRIESELEAVEMKTSKDEGMLDVDITIGGKTYEAHTDLFEEWKAEDMRYEVVGTYGYGGFVAGDSGAYYRAGIYIYHKDYDYSVHNGHIAIDIPLAYNPELNAFEAVEGEYIVHNLR